MSSSHKFMVVKSSGELVPFDVERLKNSLARSGASKNVINRIVLHIQSILFDGISTKEIYKKAFSLLRQHSRPTAARYKLKNAIYELGPTGFPFEKFVGAILALEGFTTEVGVIVQGHCVKHEVDVVANKKDRQYMVECKFHSRGNFCDVKVPLYIHSRFHDINKKWEKDPGNAGRFHEGWIFTNTRFTGDAVQYGTCAGLKLVGWKYPQHGSLNERIDASGLHPITCLTTLTKQEKLMLLEIDIVLCKEIYRSPGVLYKAGISPQKHRRIIDECHDLCGI